MFIRKTNLTILCLTILGSLFYAWRAFYSGTLENDFETNVFYFKWLSVIQDVSFNPYFLLNIIIKTAEEIRAPEPISGVFFWCISIFIENPKYIIFASNLVFISVIYFCLSSLNYAVPFSFLFFLGILFGQYEFAIMDITHRFKVAVMLFFIYTTLDFKGSKFSLIFLLLALLTHLSILAAVPIIFLLKRLSLLNKNKVSLLVAFIICVVMAIIAFFLFYIVIKFSYTEGIFRGFNQLVLVVFNKLSYFTLPTFVYALSLIFVIFILLLAIFMNQIQINRVGAFILVSYIVLSIIVLGTGRMLMLYYFVLAALVPSVSNHKQSAVGIIIISSYLTLFLYSIFKGFYLGGSNILLHSLSDIGI